MKTLSSLKPIYIIIVILGHNFIEAEIFHDGQIRIYRDYPDIGDEFWQGGDFGAVDVYVGSNDSRSPGAGYLNLNQQSSLTAGSVYLGASAGGGYLHLSDPGTEMNAGGLSVGFRGGYGRLIVDSGSRFSTDSMNIVSAQWSGGGTGIARVTGEGSFLDTGTISIGQGGTGSLYVEDGASVLSDSADLGNGSTYGAFGFASVSGEGSRWDIGGSLHVGVYDSGWLAITNGGLLTSSSSARIGQYNAEDTSKVTVNGDESRWHHTIVDTNSFVLGFSSSNGVLSIADGGVVDIDASGVGETYIGNGGGPSATGTAILRVDGVGSKFETETNLIIGHLTKTGTVHSTGGGSISSGHDIVIGDGISQGTLNIEVTGNSLVRAGSDGTGNFVNNRTVNLFSYAGLAAGVYTPIEVGSTSGDFTGSGTYNAYGGIWDEVEHTFTVSTVVDATAGLVAEDLSGDRFSFFSNDLVAAFEEGAGVADFAVADLSLAQIGGQTVQDAYGFTTDLTGSDVYLSFMVGEGFASEDFTIWYRPDAGSEWAEISPENFSYTNGWVNFTVSGFSDYAITAVPEPAAYAILAGLFAFSLCVVRRRI